MSKEKKFNNLFLILAIAIASGNTIAQDKVITKKESPLKQVKTQSNSQLANQKNSDLASVKFSMTMLEGMYFNKTYPGYSVTDIIQSLEKIVGIKKGEFESTVDFNNRRASALNEKTLQGSSIDDTFAFVTSVVKNEGYSHGIKYNFNADSGDVNLYILPSSSKYRPINGIGAPNFTVNRQVRRDLDKFVMNTVLDSKSTYKGSNAYGASVMVDKTVSSNFGIAANKIPFLKFEREIIYRNPIASGSFKLENSRAAVELPNLKALIVMKLAEPYIEYNFSSIEPKRDNPIDIQTQEKLLAGDILGVIFYSGLTGEIFARIPDGFGKLE